MPTIARQIARYGWRPQLPDPRDRVLELDLNAPLPPSVDLRPECPPVYDQLQTGSCTANATAALVQFTRMKHGMQNYVPSRLFIYWFERALEGTVGYDSGAQLRDGVKVMAQHGPPPESLWPFEPALLLT